MKSLVFLKLGGSLITNKSKPFTTEPNVILTMAALIRTIRQTDPDIDIILGNGGGSFPHHPAVKYGMKQGIRDEKSTFGFCLVQDAAAQLNRIVVKSLLDEKISACSVSPSSCMTADSDGNIAFSSPHILQDMLANSILPCLYGDILMGGPNGSTIVSTETIFDVLAKSLDVSNYGRISMIHTSRVAGVLDHQDKVITTISQHNLADAMSHIYTVEGFDVTGGMKHKVESLLSYTNNKITSFIGNPIGDPDGFLNAMRGTQGFGTYVS